MIRIPIDLIVPVKHKELGMVTRLIHRNLLDGDSDLYDNPNPYEARTNLLVETMIEANGETIKDKKVKKAIVQSMVEPVYEYAFFKLLEGSDPGKAVRIPWACSYCSHVFRAPALQPIPNVIDDEGNPAFTIETELALQLQELIVVMARDGSKEIEQFVICHATAKDMEECFQEKTRNGMRAFGRALRVRKIKDAGGMVPSTALVSKLSITDTARWDEWDAQQRILGFMQLTECPKCKKTVPYPRDPSNFF